MKTIELHGKRYTCTLTDRFRRHRDDELADIRRTAEADGILVPVRIYRDTTIDQSRCVLDGEGRLTVAADLELDDVPMINEGDLTTDEAFERAKVFNDARRQDDPEEVRKRRLERVKEKREAGKSIRTIAEEENVSKTQVERDLDELSRGGTVETPEKVTGKDGKERHSKKRDTQVSRGGAPEPTTAEDTVVEELTADEPTEPQLRYGSATDCRKVVASAARKIRGAREELSGLLSTPFRPLVMNLAESYTRVAFAATDRTVELTKYGGLSVGHTLYSNDAFDELLSYLAGLDDQLGRVDALPIGRAAAPWEESGDSGQDVEL